MCNELVAENSDPFSPVFVSVACNPPQLCAAVLIIELDASDLGWRQDDLEALQLRIVWLVSRPGSRNKLPNMLYITVLEMNSVFCN